MVVFSEWLDDIGLPQYKDQFAEARVDGRMLHYLTVVSHCACPQWSSYLLSCSHWSYYLGSCSQRSFYLGSCSLGHVI